MKNNIPFKYVIQILWLNILVSIVNIGLIIKYYNSNSNLVLISIIPLCFKFLILYYLNCKRDIINNYTVLSALTFFSILIMVYFGKINAFDIPFYFQGFLFLITFIILVTNDYKSIFIETDTKLNKNANRAIIIFWIFSTVLSKNLNSAYIKEESNRLKDTPNNILNENDSTRLVVNSLPEIVLEINKSCPKLIDNITRLDSCYSNRLDTSINFIYTLTKYSKSDLNIKTFKKNVSVFLKEKCKTDNSTKFFLRHHINIKFVYFDKNDDSLFTIHSKEF